MGREDADSDTLDGFHQAQRLQDADGLPDHRARNVELVFQMFGQHDVASGKGAAHNPGSQMLYGAVVEAG
ncbi:hypothetical protein StoSoilA2_26930 [Arthrobacter sp. StoSoilA2]|nr:hypothetical protein StoSoilA2_26930 [Arthrobacter sp. StoSoilA2]BCW48789.1 hypothetical protein StoSoilB13_11310 [Arthrobacter sp. StoSoilB13]